MEATRQLLVKHRKPRKLCCEPNCEPNNHEAGMNDDMAHTCLCTYGIEDAMPFGWDHKIAG